MIDDARLQAVYHLQHQHRDGEWAEMRPHPSPAQDDPERGWLRGIVFRCTRCDETATVVPGELDEGVGAA
jgi:hypothetical protein